MSFTPGDKVVRVGGNTPGVLLSDYPHGRGPKYGLVYVVRDCWICRGMALCQFVGFADIFNSAGDPCGWPASAFRKLEEIQAENKQTEQKEIQAV